MGFFDEEPLAGGLEAARVVRIGATVRRPAGPWTGTIHALLKHLEDKGFPAPRACGFDDQGREVLDYLEGQAGNWPWPAALKAPQGPREIGEMLARYHRDAADFVPPSPSPAIWRHGREDLAPGEIVLHGDFAPYNLIWRSETLAGVIDWDLARPGRPIHDAAFAALKCAPLRADIAPLGFDAPPNRRARLEAFAEGYSGPFPAELVEAMFETCAGDIGRMERLGGQGIEPWSEWIQRGLLARTREEMAWLRDWAVAEGLG